MQICVAEAAFNAMRAKSCWNVTGCNVREKGLQTAIIRKLKHASYCSNNTNVKLSQAPVRCIAQKTQHGCKDSARPAVPLPEFGCGAPSLRFRLTDRNLTLHRSTRGASRHGWADASGLCATKGGAQSQSRCGGRPQYTLRIGFYICLFHIWSRRRGSRLYEQETGCSLGRSQAREAHGFGILASAYRIPIKA
jgi:hypothetical protein